MRQAAQGTAGANDRCPAVEELTLLAVSARSACLGASHRVDRPKTGKHFELRARERSSRFAQTGFKRDRDGRGRHSLTRPRAWGRRCGSRCNSFQRLGAWPMIRGTVSPVGTHEFQCVLALAVSLTSDSLVFLEFTLAWEISRLDIPNPAWYHEVVTLRETTGWRGAQVPNRADGPIPATARRRSALDQAWIRVGTVRSPEYGSCGKPSTKKCHSFSLQAVASLPLVELASVGSCGRLLPRSESGPRDSKEHPEGSTATSRLLGWNERLPLLEALEGQEPLGRANSPSDRSGNPNFRIYGAPAINAMGAPGK